MRKIFAILAGAAAGAVLSAPLATADDETFAADVLQAGVSAKNVRTFQYWAPMACQLADRMGTSDSEVITYMQTDLDDIVVITPKQAALIWASAQRNIC